MITPRFLTKYQFFKTHPLDANKEKRVLGRTKPTLIGTNITIDEARHRRSNVCENIPPFALPSLVWLGFGHGDRLRTLLWEGTVG